MGDLQEKQAALKVKLEQTYVSEEIESGAIKIQANGNREISSIDIDISKLDLSDSEQLEDLLLIVTNKVLEKAAKLEAEESAQLMKDMMPPGMGDIANMLGN